MKGGISKEEYIGWLAVMKIEVLHEDYDETMKWVEEAIKDDSYPDERKSIN